MASEGNTRKNKDQQNEQHGNIKKTEKAMKGKEPQRTNDDHQRKLKDMQGLTKTKKTHGKTNRNKGTQ